MKNKILLTTILIMLALPVQVQAVPCNEPAETIQNETIVPVTQYKQPVSKRKIAKKFIFAMGGVAISSFLIFFMLTLYNKVRENFSKNHIKTPNSEVSLGTPDDIDSAIKTFLDKTKWE